MQSRQCDPNLGRAGRFPLHLEALEDRTCPTSLSLSGTTLTITGTPTDNTVVVRDQGNGNVTAYLETAQGKMINTLSARGVQTITINSIKANEVVDYTLAGPLTTSYAHTLNIATGSGKNEVNLNLAAGFANSTFNLNLQTGTGTDVIDAVFGGIANSHVNANVLLGTDQANVAVQMMGGIKGISVFNVNEKGGSGVDSLAFAMNGTIASGAAVNVALTGGTRSDTMNTSYTGLLAGKLSLVTTDGSGGDKDTSNVIVASTSTGTLVDHLVAGPSGDVLNMTLQDTAKLKSLSAAILGRSGLDVAIVSKRIQVSTPAATQTNRLAGSGVLSLDLSWNGTSEKLTATAGEAPTPTPVPGPEPTAGAAYSPVQGTLFNPATNVPVYQDVQQEQLSDCWLLGTLAEVAARDPSVIEQMFHYDGTTVENGSVVGVFTVRLYDFGLPVSVVVDTELPAGGGLYDSPVNGVLWAALAEKAYVEAASRSWVSTNDPGVNSYSALNYGIPNGAMRSITGQSAVENPTNANDLVTAWKSGQLLTLGTLDTGNNLISFNGAYLVPNHLYAVVGYNASTGVFTLFNPWGVSGGHYILPNGQTSPFCAGMVTGTASQLAAAFGYEVIGNA
jgi:hypothetical protein